MFTEADAAELARLEDEFELAGGRGVDLAEAIDALRAKRDGSEYRIVVELDNDFGWWSELDDATREDIDAGVYAGYSVAVHRVLEAHEQGPDALPDFILSPYASAALFGIVVEECNAANVYSRPEDLPDPYLAEIAAELLDEARELEANPATGRERA